MNNLLNGTLYRQCRYILALRMNNLIKSAHYTNQLLFNIINNYRLIF